MVTKPLFVLLCSGEREKVQMAAMVVAVAAVSDRPIQLFVSMNAVLAFEKGRRPEERYHGGKFATILQEKKAPDPVELIVQGKMLGELKVYACSMALDVLGWELENLIDGVFDGALGLTKFLADAETGDFVTF
ncbi:MAG: DsrE/DsrF/DrsH-like family protein [Alphaproteobacteria bacterium]|nr:DsrE/DsrF/DrsH-like family protein [Alphaproteobacteria bacterium]